MLKHHCILRRTGDIFGLINQFLEVYPASALVLDSNNSVLTNFSKQFPYGASYTTSRSFGEVLDFNIDAPPYTKVPEKLKTNISNTLQKIINAYPEAVFQRGDDGRLPIENIYHRYQIDGRTYYSTCADYLLPLLNVGGGVNASFPSGMTYGGASLFSNMSKVFHHKLLVGAMIGGMLLSRQTLGFETGIFNLEDLKSARNQFTMKDLSQLYKVISKAVLIIDEKSLSYNELSSMKNYLAAEINPSLFFRCLTNIARHLDSKGLDLKETLEKLPVDLKEPVIDAYLHLQCRN